MSSHVALKTVWILISWLLQKPADLGLPCVDPGIFVSGGTGQSDKKSSDNVSFFLVLSLFYRSQMVSFKEIYHFSRFQRGSNFFQGGGGVQLLIPYRNPYNL